MCSMDTVCLLFCLADRHNLLTLRQKTLPLYWNGKQLEFFQWTKWVILWAASKCCAILSIMRYINRNSRAVIGDKCTSSINRWTPPPAPPHQGNAHVMCTSTKQLASWDNVVKESLRQSLLAVINMKQVVCRNCDRSLPCWGSTTNLLGWKREVWVS